MKSEGLVKSWCKQGDFEGESNLKDVFHLLLNALDHEERTGHNTPLHPIYGSDTEGAYPAIIKAVKRAEREGLVSVKWSYSDIDGLEHYKITMKKDKKSVKKVTPHTGATKKVDVIAVVITWPKIQRPILLNRFDIDAYENAQDRRQDVADIQETYEETIRDIAKEYGVKVKDLEIQVTTEQAHDEATLKKWSSKYLDITGSDDVTEEDLLRKYFESIKGPAKNDINAEPPKVVKVQNDSKKVRIRCENCDLKKEYATEQTADYQAFNHASKNKHRTHGFDSAGKEVIRYSMTGQKLKPAEGFTIETFDSKEVQEIKAKAPHRSKVKRKVLVDKTTEVAATSPHIKPKYKNEEGSQNLESLMIQADAIRKAGKSRKQFINAVADSFPVRKRAAILKAAKVDKFTDLLEQVWPDYNGILVYYAIWPDADPVKKEPIAAEVIPSDRPVKHYTDKAQRAISKCLQWVKKEAAKHSAPAEAFNIECEVLASTDPRTEDMLTLISEADKERREHAAKMKKDTSYSTFDDLLPTQLKAQDYSLMWDVVHAYQPYKVWTLTLEIPGQPKPFLITEATLEHYDGSVKDRGTWEEWIKGRQEDYEHKIKDYAFMVGYTGPLEYTFKTIEHNSEKAYNAFLKTLEMIDTRSNAFASRILIPYIAGLAGVKRHALDDNLEVDCNYYGCGHGILSYGHDYAKKGKGPSRWVFKDRNGKRTDVDAGIGQCAGSTKARCPFCRQMVVWHGGHGYQSKFGGGLDALIISQWIGDRLFVPIPPELEHYHPAHDFRGKHKVKTEKVEPGWKLSKQLGNDDNSAIEMVDSHESNQVLKLVGEITEKDKKKALKSYDEHSKEFRSLWSSGVKIAEKVKNIAESARERVDDMIRDLVSAGYTQGEAINKIAEDHKGLQGLSRASLYRYLPQDMKRSYTRKPLPETVEPAEAPLPETTESESRPTATSQTSTSATGEALLEHEEPAQATTEFDPSKSLAETLRGPPVKVEGRPEVITIRSRIPLQCGDEAISFAEVSDLTPDKKEYCESCMQHVSVDLSRPVIQEILVNMTKETPTTDAPKSVVEELEGLRNTVTQLREDNKRMRDMAIKFSEDKQKLEKELRDLKAAQEQPAVSTQV